MLAVELHIVRSQIEMINGKFHRTTDTAICLTGFKFFFYILLY